MPRTARPRDPGHARLPVLPTGAAALACVAALASGATPARADTARMRVSAPSDLRGPQTVRITVTSAAGAVRRLPRLRTSGAPAGLIAAPDGRHLLVLPEEEDDDAVAYVVPTDGGPAVALTPPAAVSVELPWSGMSWDADGTGVVVGDAIRTVPAPGADPTDPAAPRVPTTLVALRCPVTTGACAELPGPGGAAVGMPGGALVSSSLLSLLPLDYLFAGAGDTAPPTWARPQSGWGRLLRDVHDTPRTVATHLEGPAPRTLSALTRTTAQGLPHTAGLVGGPSGAVGYRYGFGTTLERRRGRIRLVPRESGPRLLMVAPDGTVAVRAVPRVRVTRRDLRVDRPRRAQALRFLPTLGRPGGGWIGYADRKPDPLRPGGPVLATMTQDGRARAVRIAGRAATAETIVRALRRPPAFEYLEGMAIAGFERATRSVVVTVGLGRYARNVEPITVEVSVRVPLEGRGRPTILPARADTAW